MSELWTFNGESPPVGGPQGQTVTLVDGATFAVGQASGDVGAGPTEGVYLLDTRVISRWEWTIDGQPVEPLTVIPNGPFSATFAGRRTGSDIDSGVFVLRHRHLGNGMREDIEIRALTDTDLHTEVRLRSDADFASLFDVKSGHEVEVPPATSALSGDRLTIASGSDTTVSATVIDFHPRPDRFDGGDAVWLLDLESGAPWALCVEVGIVANDVHLAPSYRCGEPVDQAVPVTRFRNWQAGMPTLDTNDDALRRASERATEDLGSLRIFDPEHADRVVVAAGAPWFMTLFGRDSLIAAHMALLVDHALARGVLAELADGQGQSTNLETEEEPGRILHEVRFDHASTRLLGGDNVYFGTVDATPLFVMLTDELVRWTGDLALAESLLPNVDRAMAWIAARAEAGDGFVSYERTGPHGLENQGWKDSWDGIRWADGAVARAPLALAEVQGYVFAAHQARAHLADALGDPPTAMAHRAAADDVRARFDDAFWLPERGFYAVAIDGEGRAVDGLSSNIGHCLWSGIVPQERAATMAGLLASPDLRSGWGLRTLATRNPGYNPLSYHCGSVWPHDTAIAIAGLHRYGLHDEANLLTRDLLDASAAFGGRLPELFGGFGRDDIDRPIPYPTSCSPQAWAAAAPLLLVRSMLGLDPDLPGGRIGIRPRLPDGVDQLHVHRVPLGSTRVDIVADRTGVELRGAPDGVDVVLD